MKRDIIKFNKLREGVFHVTLPNLEMLAEAMIRFQEHYESPFPEIRGKIFTVGFVQSLGNKKTGLNTYTGGNSFRADWGGYNFPSYVLEPFIRGLFDPLTPLERDMVEVFRFRTGKYYVIATLEGEDPMEALRHEISHALYYIEPGYKADVDKVLKKYNLDAMFNWLRDMGYCEEVLQDEAQAYLGEDYDWLLEKEDKVKEFGFKVPRKCHNELKAVKAKYEA